MYTAARNKNTKEDDGSGKESDENSDEATLDQQSIIDVMITGTEERSMLPEVIELQNTSPGELKNMRKRRKPAVL